MSKQMYMVTLKLDQPDVRYCHRLQDALDRKDRVTHSAYGWYDVQVSADSDEDAIERAKQRLAEYKNVRVEDFFENTSQPEAWSLDLFLVCPECQRQYKGWQMARLEHYVCPYCRRRCNFEEDKSRSASRSFTQQSSDLFG